MWELTELSPHAVVLPKGWANIFLVNMEF